jgi:hypothetical protein
MVSRTSAVIPTFGQTTLTTPFGIIQVSDKATLEAARTFLTIVETRMKEEKTTPKSEPKKEQDKSS